MRLGYVCTNYNNARFTEDAVRSLLRGTAHQYRVVVVDNKSGPDDVARLQKIADEFPEVSVIFNKENVGYFRGLNVGIKRLRTDNPDLDHMVVGNNDLVFPPEFGDAVARNLPKLKKYPVISPNIVTLDGERQNPHVISRIGRFRETIYDVYYSNYALAQVISAVAKFTRRFTDRDDETHHAIAQEIWQGHGSCYLLGPIFFQEFHELWAPSFLMGEEFFLSQQLSEKGMKIFYEPSITVQHYCHAALGAVPSRRIWELSRDAHKVYRKYVKVFDKGF